MLRGALLGLLGATAPAAVAQCEPVWSGLNGGAGWEVRALATFDEDGPGPLPPALFIGGGFYRIAGIESNLLTRWDGWAASKVGSGLEASDYGLAHLGVVSEQAGMIPAGLYAGGELDSAGGLPVNNLARWRAGQWHDVAGGVTEPGRLIPYVFAIQLFDEDGAGPQPPALFIGGIFDHAGGVPADGLARWDGQRWSPVGAGLSTHLPGLTFPSVNAMAVYDDGRGSALYVGGSFDYAGGERANDIARWGGASWEPVGGSVDATVESLCVFDEDGPGPKRPALFVGGQFRTGGGGAVRLYRIGRWDGAGWTDVGGWLSDGVITAMHVWDADGPGPLRENLYIGGSFNILPDLTPVANVARWDGTKWWDVGGGVTGFGAGTGVSALAAFDEDGPGPNPGGLYVGGLFYYAGGVYSKHIARWGCPLGPRPCAADCDGDTELTFFDFLCFQNQFAFADMRADCDRSGALDLFDFLCFQDSFAMGCP